MASPHATSFLCLLGMFPAGPAPHTMMSLGLAENETCSVAFPQDGYIVPNQTQVSGNMC
jgi:hypothetical protein